MPAADSSTSVSPNKAPVPSTEGVEYTNRLVKVNKVWWKKLLNVQAPYRWNLHRQKLGRCLDVGCGTGRNLAHLSLSSVGIDHNPLSVEEAKKRGLSAFIPEKFRQLGLGIFDSLLIAHVLEHMNFEQGRALLIENLAHIKPGGKVMLICPQEAGYRSDSTHVEYLSQESLKRMAKEAGLRVLEQYSFPFPSFVGKFFRYNENVLIALKPG